MASITSIQKALMENLKQLQLAEELTVEEFASKLGMSLNYTYQVLAGTRQMGLAMFAHVVRVYPGFADLFKRLARDMEITEATGDDDDLG